MFSAAIAQLYKRSVTQVQKGQVWPQLINIKQLHTSLKPVDITGLGIA